MVQSAGAFLFWSMIISPMCPATVMLPLVGFLMLVTSPLMLALTVLYSSIRLASAPKVQSTSVRSSQ